MALSTAPEWDKALKILADPAVSEVESNGGDSFFIKKSGKRIQIPGIFLSDDEYSKGVEEGLVPVTTGRMGMKYGVWLYESTMEYDYDGRTVRARCHIVLPPSARYPMVTIAKKSESLRTIEGIAAAGSMSTEMMNFLAASVKSEITMVFSGSTGSGKTTMLEALSKLIPDDTRIGVAEDIPELRLAQKNVAYLGSVPFTPGMDPKDTATLDWVVQQFQRMRTDRVIVGETRGLEFASFLVAANSGMEGSMTTLHADDVDGALNKMTMFAIMGMPNLPVRFINRNIGETVELVVQLNLVNGLHRVTGISEVTAQLGQGEDAGISTVPLYKWDENEDKFYKDIGYLSDRYKNKLAVHGFDYNTMFRDEMGRRVRAHQGVGVTSPDIRDRTDANSGGQRSGGVPIRREFPTGPGRMNGGVRG